MAPKEALPPNLVELSDRQAMGVFGAEINTAASMLALQPSGKGCGYGMDAAVPAGQFGIQ